MLAQTAADETQDMQTRLKALDQLRKLDELNLAAERLAHDKERDKASAGVSNVLAIGALLQGALPQLVGPVAKVQQVLAPKLADTEDVVE